MSSVEGLYDSHDNMLDCRLRIIAREIPEQDKHWKQKLLCNCHLYLTLLLNIVFGLTILSRTIIHSAHFKRARVLPRLLFF